LSANGMYNSIGHRRDRCVNSETAADTILSLPVHAWLRDDEVNVIIRKFGDFFI